MRFMFNPVFGKYYKVLETNLERAKGTSDEKEIRKLLPNPNEFHCMENFKKCCDELNAVGYYIYKPSLLRDEISDEIIEQNFETISEHKFKESDILW